MPTWCSTVIEAPSFLQVPGAKDVGVEFYTLSKAYNMPGWRVGFCVGNREVVGALAKIKSYLDYGIFQPLQIASVIALNGPQDCVKETVPALSKAARCARGRAQSDRVEGSKTSGHDVRVGENSRARIAAWALWSFRSCCCEMPRLPCHRVSALVKAATSMYALLWLKMSIGRARRCAELGKALKLEGEEE